MLEGVAMLIEEAPEIEERGGLFYIAVQVGGEKMVFVARPNLFFLGVQQAKIAGRNFFKRSKIVPFERTG